MRIGITTSGGDCAGLNAAIYGVIKSAAKLSSSHKKKFEILGLRGGFDALYQEAPLEILDLQIIKGLVKEGGTILGTSNKGSPFRDPNTKDKMIAKMIMGAKNHRLDGVIVIGGEGSHGMAKHLLNHGLKFIGIGKTIDNDMMGNDKTIGFASAVETAVQAAERIVCTAKSHQRIMLLEVMGRDSGFLALESGLASEADFILLPEFPFVLENLGAYCKQLIAHQGFGLGVVSEGAKVLGGAQVFSKTGAVKEKLGGIGDQLALDLWTKFNVEARSVKLGHIQRGGSPIASDRILALQLGVRAIEAMLNPNTSDTLIACQNNQFVEIPYAEISFEQKRKLSATDALYLSAQKLGVFLG
ncbi:MAG: ATP-dependent 6-phosphofructokinase [Oligoflexales bacterium]|nr:ATP-dependent 6-phosphofructokinase [Oligoflexales bacterium]